MEVLFRCLLYAARCEEQYRVVVVRVRIKISADAQRPDTALDVRLPVFIVVGHLANGK